MEDRALADRGIADREVDASACAAGRGFRSELEAGAPLRPFGGAQGQSDAGLGPGGPAVVRVAVGEGGPEVGRALVLDQGSDGSLVLDLPYFLSGSSMQEDNCR